MRVFAMTTPPNSASFSGPTTRITTNSEPTMKLNRVKTLALMISATVRVGASGTSLRSPRAARSAASAEVRPTRKSVEVTVVRYGRPIDGLAFRPVVIRSESEYGSHSWNCAAGYLGLVAVPVVVLTALRRRRGGVERDRRLVPRRSGRGGRVGEPVGGHRRGARWGLRRRDDHRQRVFGRSARLRAVTRGPCCVR